VSDYVVDQAVFVGDAGLRESVPEIPVEDFLEQILEAAVIGLENGVLGRQIDRNLAGQAVIEAGAGETLDAVVQVVHAHGDAGRREVVDVVGNRLAAVGRAEGHRQLARTRHPEIGGAVLVAESMTGDDDRLGPTGHQTRHVAADDRFAEDGAAQHVTDRAVGRFPHLLQIEFLNARLVRGDGRALHADAVLLDRIGRIESDLIRSLVPVLNAQIVVFQVDIEIG
jgi:hypothetical protein